MLDTITTTSNATLATLAPMVERARDFAAASKAENTVRAYRSDLAHFRAWCECHALGAFPASASTVALYVSALADDGFTVATIRRRLSSVSQAHQLAGHTSPTHDARVRVVVAGIRRTLGTAPVKKAAALVDDVRAMVATLGDGLLAMRDRALLLVGFAGAFRRSELVALDVADVEFTRAGVVLSVRRSKTDQEGEGRRVAIPFGRTEETCPVRALRTWLAAASIEDGAVFRSVNRHGQVNTERLSDKAVALVVKRTALACGFDPSRYAGHSLRSGLATSAAAAGADERSIMRQGGWRSVTVARGYIREGDMFRANAAGSVGL